MRPRWAMIVNLLVPGAGLIGLRREWLGLAVALLFGILAQISLMGVLLLPAVIPTRVSVLTAMAAATVWGWAQWLLVRRLRASCGQAAERQHASLLHRADKALACGNMDEAADLLRAALNMNDEHVETLWQWAQLSVRAGRMSEASWAWDRILQLEHDPGRLRAIRAAREAAER